MLTTPQMHAVQATLEDIETEGLLEYQYLFALAGRLRGSEAGLRQSDRRAAHKFVPAALEFARLVEEQELGRGIIDWGDPDSVALEFEKAWSSRRLPKNTNIFETAVKLSENNFLMLSSTRNKWVNRVANLAFCLSEMLPDTPTLIPISDKTADMLGTSLRTLSLAVQEVIRERLVLVIEKPDQSLPARRARRLKFNSKQPLVASHIDQSRKHLREVLAQIDTTS
jgi:hypothetical protein